MKRKIISIAGDLGSGKTTVTKLMQRDLGYEIYRNGTYFRKLAGVIRRFETKEQAKAYAKSVNETGVDSFAKEHNAMPEPPVRHQGDVFVPSEK